MNPYDNRKDDDNILEILMEEEELPDAIDWDESDTVEEVEWDELAESGMPRCDSCKQEVHPREMTGALCFECLVAIEEEGLVEY